MRSNADIRLASQTDIAAITALVNDAYAPYIPRMGRKPAPMLADYAQVILQRQVFVVEVQGMVRGVLVLEQQGDVLHLQNIAVSPDARGQGLGRELMQFSERQAGELGCSAIELYTHERMHENILIYTKLGYRETHRAIDQGYARVFMRKDLTA